VKLHDPLEDAARALMERVHGRARLTAEQPLLFDPRFTGRLLALHGGGKVRSACALLVREFVAQGSRVRGGLIGCVTTDPAFGRRGFATRLLAEAEAELARAGCAFALLWADDPRFYLERGYGPVGRELDFLLPGGFAAALPRPSGVRAMRAGDEPAIHALYCAHATRVERTAQESAALLACPGMTTLVLERAGAVAAYACLGRGADLGDAIHEWGGATEDVLGLLGAQLAARAAADADGAAFVLVPPAEQELAARLVELGAVSSMGMLGLGRILDRGAALALLRERLAPHGSAALDPDGSSIRLRGPRGEAFLDDEASLALLLGVEGVRHEVASLLAGLGLEAARLPVDVFAWGLDSI
jgi:GNAT superfamily N-acetyltransferase